MREVSTQARSPIRKRADFKPLELQEERKRRNDVGLTKETAAGKGVGGSNEKWDQNFGGFIGLEGACWV